MQFTKTLFQGLESVCMQLADGSQATVTLAGAHLVSWIPADGQEQTYISPRSAFAPGQPIRGGVPVIFPQFSTRGPIVRHGFARLSLWEVLEETGSDTHASLTLGLGGNGAADWNWPHDYACELQFTLAPDALTMQLTVRNTGDSAFSFAAALHTYLNIGELGSVAITGLQGCDYEDSMDGNVRKTDHEAVLAPKDGLDRVYLQTPSSLQLRSAQGALALQSTGFPDSVVWNPGQTGCAKIADLPADAYPQFICVEAALVEKPFELQAGGVWVGSQGLLRRTAV